MYNRYIPQPDGSYQRNRMPDPSKNHKQQPCRQSQPPCSPQPPEKPQHHDSFPPAGRHPDSILGIFRNLLPKNIDTGDLIIVLLLLLISNDCEKDRNHALLTLALYFFF